MAFPAALSSLTTREAIQDGFVRVLAAYDTADLTLLESGFTKDAVFILGDERMQGLDKIKEESFNRVSKLDTTHFLSNVRIDIKTTATATTTAAGAGGAPGGGDENASRARLYTSGLAYHWRTGQGTNPNATRFISGSLHDVDLIKDTTAATTDGLWKIQEWRMKLVWVEGDASVMSGN